jgi:hypothetical protein
MSLPITKVLSNVQSDIGDISMSIIQEGEYLDFINDALSEVASKTELWIVRYTKIPLPIGTVITSPLYQVFIPYQDINGIIAPDHILRIVRQNGTTTTETREYSIQALSATTSGNQSFPNNYNQLSGNSFAAQYDSTDGIIITFASPIELTESIVIDFVTSNPMTIKTWIQGNDSATMNQAMTQQATAQGTTASVVIPDMLYTPLYLGTLFKAIQRMFLKGDDKMANRMQYIKAEYEKELLVAIRKSKMFKDNNSRPQIQPYNWLPE